MSPHAMLRRAADGTSTAYIIGRRILSRCTATLFCRMDHRIDRLLRPRSARGPNAYRPRSAGDAILREIILEHGRLHSAGPPSGVRGVPVEIANVVVAIPPADWKRLASSGIL